MNYKYTLIILLIILILTIISFIFFCIKLYNSYKQQCNKYLGGEKPEPNNISTIYNCDYNTTIYELYKKPIREFESVVLKHHGFNYLILKLINVISEKIEIGNNQKAKLNNVRLENKNIKEITLYGNDFDKNNMVSFNLMFANCTNLEKVVLDKSLKDIKLNNLAGMFYNCTKLKIIIGLENLNVKDVVDFGGMFRDCKSLEEINFGKIFKSNKKMIYLDEMFYNCSNLKTINGFKKELNIGVDISDNIFHNCSNLKLKVNNKL